MTFNQWWRHEKKTLINYGITNTKTLEFLKVSCHLAWLSGSMNAREEALAALEKVGQTC